MIRRAEAVLAVGGRGVILRARPTGHTPKSGGLQTPAGGDCLPCVGGGGGGGFNVQPVEGSGRCWALVGSGVS